MKTLRVLLGDQLSRTVSALRDIDITHDVVLMIEVRAETRYVHHHKQKLVLILSAMRHFALELGDNGIEVDYVQLDASGNTGTFTAELARALRRHHIDRIVVTEPSEWRVWQIVQSWKDLFDTQVEIRVDDRFFCTRDEFAKWADKRNTLRMEYFYREMRRKTGWLIEGDKPEGGRWNYDADNRKSISAETSIPSALGFEADKITHAVMNLVAQRFNDHFGELESFSWATTRNNALEAMHHFMTHCLPRFGDYQDAMKAGEDFLFHSLLSPYLNIGLLLPREVCEAALTAYRRRNLPLNAVEGFIRQILGWREYIRGIYWLNMPAYAESNYLNATRSLPAFYWTGDTDMNCLHEVIETTRHNAYAHHIQRLMITGNFALLTGIAPDEVETWYLSVYADAFEWVELPNTHGMALYADGGQLASKPYAASASYINRMSDYCTNCAYEPQTKLGPAACPFNYLYWYFMMKNEAQLKANQRMAMPYRTLARMSDEKRLEIVKQANAFLESLV